MGSSSRAVAINAVGEPLLLYTVSPAATSADAAAGAAAAAAAAGQCM